MSKKIGFNPVRDPYPWDNADLVVNSATWSCCGMNLPATYHLCPMCEKERDEDAFFMQRACAGC
jgi:hypothetical protein